MIANTVGLGRITRMNGLGDVKDIPLPYRLGPDSTTLHLVVVQWDDSEGTAHWHSFEEARTRASTVTSVGLLLDLTETDIILTQSVVDDLAFEMAHNSIRIPRAAVTDMGVIATVEKEAACRP